MMISYIYKDIIKKIISKNEVITMKRTLIVVDMQKDFIDGTLGTKEAVGILQTKSKNTNSEVMK